VIPPVAHFVWLGNAFPWVYGLALRSAARRGGLDRVVLHATDDVCESAGWRWASEDNRIALRRLEPEGLLAEMGTFGGALVDLFRRLRQPAAKANVLRVAILVREGGVYLDTDTVTVRSLRPLLDARAFCGVEHVALPGPVYQSRRPWPWAKAGGLLLLREALRQIEPGYRWFRFVASLYAQAANNAVLGSVPESRLLTSLLQGMAEMSSERQGVRYALGTHLLQTTLATLGSDEVDVYPPNVFYPLGPELSHHWFRIRREVNVPTALSCETRVVHWYASVRTAEVLPKIDEAYVRRHAREQMFSNLAMSFLEPDSESRLHEPKCGRSDASP